MTNKASELLHAIYGMDIYADFSPLLPLDLQGWNSEHITFRDIIANDHPSIVFDVGVWKGGSTIFLANLLRENGVDGAVIAVDTFLGSPEHWDSDGLGHLVLRRHGRLLLYEQFLSNVVYTGTQDLIVPLAQTSESAAAILSRLQVCAGLIHIDAAHDYESVFRDARNYWELLQRGGYLVGVRKTPPD